MNKKNDLEEYKRYKKSQKLVTDLQAILSSIDASIKLFATHYKYVPVRDIIANMLENKAFIKERMKKYEDIVLHYEQD